MKRILLYFLMAFSMAVFAQPQAGDSAPDSAPDTNEAQIQTEQPPDAAQGSEEETLEASDKTGNGDEAVAQQSADTGQDAENESPEILQETDPDDSDFKPGEEISEDYPVPLPSDI